MISGAVKPFERHYILVLLLKVLGPPHVPKASYATVNEQLRNLNMNDNANGKEKEDGPSNSNDTSQKQAVSAKNSNDQSLEYRSPLARTPSNSYIQEPPSNNTQVRKLLTASKPSKISKSRSLSDHALTAKYFKDGGLGSSRGSLGTPALPDFCHDGNGRTCANKPLAKRIRQSESEDDTTWSEDVNNVWGSHVESTWVAHCDENN